MKLKSVKRLSAWLLSAMMLTTSIPQNILAEEVLESYEEYWEEPSEGTYQEEYYEEYVPEEVYEEVFEDEEYIPEEQDIPYYEEEELLIDDNSEITEEETNEEVIEEETEEDLIDDGEAEEVEGANATVTSAHLTSQEDGAGNWDADDNRGNDSGAANGRVRSFDTITYQVAGNYSDVDVDTQYIAYSFSVPLADWNNGTKFEPNGDAFWNEEFTDSEVIYTAVFPIYDETKASTGGITKPFALTVGNRIESDIINPSFSVYMAELDENGNFVQIGDDVTVNTDPVYVTSAPMYNVVLKSSRVSALNSIDFSAGQDSFGDTDEDGHYKFEDLEPGTYKVVFEKTDLPLTKKSEESTDEQMTSLAEKSAEGGEIAEIYMPTDSEIAQENGFTADESGNYNDPHEDGGFKYEDYNRVITGKAWFDNGNEETNHDGSLDKTDNVIPGITVILEKYNEETKEYEKVTETVTGEDGTYRFEDLEEGEYRVVFENDQPLTDKETEGVDSENNSKADQKVENGKIHGEISSIKLPSDEEIKAISEGKEPGADGSYDSETKTFERSNQNAGYIGYSRSLEGTAWLDINKNGLYEEETGDRILENVPVTLYRKNAEGEYEAVKGEDGENLTVNTDEDGHYKFEDLEPGTYKVVFEKTDLLLTKKSEESTDEQMTSLAEKSEEGGEIAEIYMPTDSEIAQENGFTADESGNYNDPHEDGGFKYEDYNRVITGKAWFDNGNEETNHDGSLDETDNVIPGITVILEKYNEETKEYEKVTETVTGEDGTYRFEDLEEGEYRVVFENDQPLTDKETEGVDSENNSKADQKVENGKIRGEISSIKLPSDEEIKAISEGKEPGADGSYDPETKTFERSNQNAGYIGYSRSLEGTAWLDSDRDGVYDESKGDSLLKDVPVTLYRQNEEGEYEAVKGEDGENLTVNTDENGHYKFEDLEPGTYKVVFEYSLELTKKSEESTDEQMTSLTIVSTITNADGTTTTIGGEIEGIYLPTDSEIASEQEKYPVDESGNYNVPHEDSGFIMPIPTVTPTNDPTVTPTVTPAKDPTVTPTVRPGNGGGNGGSGGYSGGKGGMSTGGIKTGDNTNIIGFVMILILAAAVICGIIFTKRRKKAE